MDQRLFAHARKALSQAFQMTPADPKLHLNSQSPASVNLTYSLGEEDGKFIREMAEDQRTRALACGRHSDRLMDGSSLLTGKCPTSLGGSWRPAATRNSWITKGRWACGARMACRPHSHPLRRLGHPLHRCLVPPPRASPPSAAAAVGHEADGGEGRRAGDE